MVTPFALFCLLLGMGLALQAAGLLLVLHDRQTVGFWLLLTGAFAAGGAAVSDGDATLLLGQVLTSAILGRILWNGFPALLKAAWPDACRCHWNACKNLYKQTAMFVLAIIAVMALPLLAPDTETLHRLITDLTGMDGNEPTLQACLVYVGIAALLSCVAVPRQALSFVAGLLFGALPGTLLSTIATTLACAMAFGLSRAISRCLQRRRATSLADNADDMQSVKATIPAAPSPLSRLAEKYRPQYLKLSGLLQKAPFLMALLIRLFPSGNNLLFSLLGGAMRLPALPFVGGSCVGYIPQNLIFALMGSGVYGDGGWRIAMGAGLFVTATLLGVWAWKKI